MEIGFIGLGKMGMNMVTRLRQGDHRVIAFDRSQDLITQAEGTGAIGASSLKDLISYFTLTVFCGMVMGLLFTRFHTDKEVFPSVLLGC